MARSWLVLCVCSAATLLAGAEAARGADNQVFVPLPPCRVIDTRVVGGAIAAGTTRTFFFRGPTRNYQAIQGGSSTGCGIPDLTSDASPFQNVAKAVAINIVAVGPAGAGDLRAWAANQAMPGASVINYAAVPGLNIANGVIVPMCDQVAATPCTGGDITFRADVSATHLVVDVVGYFHAGSSAFTVRNTALGHAALAADTTGKGNTASGYRALTSNTTGAANTASGGYALAGNTGGGSNTASGYAALQSNTTGSANTATGSLALLSSTTGIYNTANGYRALEFDTGSGNVAMGAVAAMSNTTGGANVAIGTAALRYSTTGSFNTGVGDSALQNNPGSSYNTAIGGRALMFTTSGGGNTAVGYSALRNHATGGYNVALGKYAGIDLATGSGNIFIANNGVDLDLNTTRIGSSQTKAFIAGIRGVTTGTNDAVNVLIDSNGQLGTVSSSIRFKEDVHDLGQASDRVLDLRPVSFRYRKPFANGEKPVQYGLIAEEVAEVFPELVVYGKDGRPETVKYQDLPTLLLNELQKERRELGEARTEIAAGHAREQDEAEKLARAGALLEAQRVQLAALAARVEALELKSPGATPASPPR